MSEEVTTASMSTTSSVGAAVLVEDGSTNDLDLNQPGIGGAAAAAGVVVVAADDHDDEEAANGVNNHHHSSDSSDSGCALEEYTWVPHGLRPQQVRSISFHIGESRASIL